MERRAKRTPGTEGREEPLVARLRTAKSPCGNQDPGCLLEWQLWALRAKTPGISEHPEGTRERKGSVRSDNVLE